MQSADRKPGSWYSKIFSLKCSKTADVRKPAFCGIEKTYERPVFIFLQITNTEKT